jgi:hypothetical protein
MTALWILLAVHIAALLALLPSCTNLPSRTEIATMARQILETAAIISSIVIVAAILGFGALIGALHRLDAIRERRFWVGQSVHS